MAALELKAFDAESRVTIKVVAQKAIGQEADENDLKSTSAKLKRKRYFGSRPGYGGGIWLTEKGREVAKAIVEKRKDGNGNNGAH